MLIIGLFRWGARLLATAAAALFIAFLVTEGTGDVRALTDAELGGLAAVFVMLAGALIGWRWDLWGGLLLLGGYGGFALIRNGWPPVAFSPFALAGVVLLLTGVVRRVRGRSPAAPAPAEPPAAAA